MPTIQAVAPDGASDADVERAICAALDAEQAAPSPILRWAGGKRAIAPLLYGKLAPHLAAHPDAFYLEPFCGGAALFLHLRGTRDRRGCVLSDINSDLIQLYTAVIADPRAVFDQLALFTHGHDKLKYLRIRDAWNGIRDTWPPARRAAAMLYLSCACFNGLWRVNQRGDFNTPCGDRLHTPTLAELRAFGNAMHGTEIRAEGFTTAMLRAKPGDVIYADPPYLPLSPTSNFAAYASGGFGIAEHETLATIARELVKRGVYVMLSNADVPETYRLYPRQDWDLEVIEAPRKIAARGASRGQVTELVITPKALS